MSGLWTSAAVRDEVLAAYEDLLAQWPAPAERRRIATTLGETHVLSFGPADGPPVILLHGSAANSASWMGDARDLARRHRVHAVDLPGEPGLSAETRAPLAGGAHAAWLSEVTAALSASQVALVGISLGGWVALDLATRAPETVSALVLLCPGGVGAQRNILPWALPLLMLGGWGRRRVLARLGGGGPPPDARSPAAVAFGALMDRIFATFRPRREPLPRFGDAELARLSMPVLAILGARDVMLDSGDTRARLSKQAADCEIVWLPEGGHILMGHGARIADFLAERVLP